MKNVTITITEETAHWARQEAARKEMSLSRFVSEMLQSEMRKSREYDAAMRRYLSRAPIGLKRGQAPYPDREHLHDR